MQVTLNVHGENIVIEGVDTLRFSGLMLTDMGSMEEVAPAQEAYGYIDSYNIALGFAGHICATDYGPEESYPIVTEFVNGQVELHAYTSKGYEDPTYTLNFEEARITPEELLTWNGEEA